MSAKVETGAKVVAIGLVKSGAKVFSAKDVPEPPTSCPTYQLESGDTTFCRRCRGTWTVGQVRACVSAADILKKALGD